MGIGVEEHQRRDETHGAPRTEAERRRAEEPLGRMDSVESVGPVVVGAEDRPGYERPSVRRHVCGAGTDQLTRTRGTPHRGPVQPGPNPSLLVRRFLFHSHVRRPGQSVAQFAAELKHLSDQCGFGSALDDALRDRLVCGLEEEAVQRRLLEEDGPLSFDRALGLALQMEAAGHVKDLQNRTGPRAVAVLHVVRDVDHLLVVKDKVPHEQNWNPGLNQNWNPSLGQKDLEPPPIKEEKEVPLTTMEGGRLRCVMQHIPVLDSLADLKLWAVKHHIPSEQKDSKPGLDQDQEDQDPPGTEEEPETLYAIKEGEQHQSPILVLGCPADIQQLWGVKEELRPGLDQDQVYPDPALTEEQEEPWASQGPKGADVSCGGPDPPHLEDCGGPEPDTNTDMMKLRRRAAPDSRCVFSESKRSVSRHTDSPAGGQLGSFGPDTTCPSLGLSDRKNALCVEGGPRPRCSKCGKGFLYDSRLKRHMMVHAAEEAHVCEKSFSHTHHLTTHTREKPFSCSAGEKRLSPKIYLRKYLINHMGERNFVCSVCDQIFVSRKKLNDHRRVHPEEKPYSCPECGLGFYVKSSVKRHMMVHTAEKPYSCSECGKRCPTKADLEGHTMVHTAEKLYSCSECGQRFSKAFSLRRHMMIHTGEKPYECSFCDKRFRQTVHLNAHMTTSHRFNEKV